MIISNQLQPCLLGIAALLTATAVADVVQLDSGNTELTGELIAINSDGIMELRSPLSEQPLKLRSDKLDSAQFPPSPHASPPAPIVLQLINGDLLTAEKVNSLDDQQLVVTSQDAGEVIIPRNTLESARFGIRPQRILFGKENNADEWVNEMEERENWRIKKNSFMARGKAAASHDIDLPDDFSISFTLEWKDDLQPDMDLLIAKSNDKASGNYRLAINRSGIQIFREYDDKRHILAQMRRTSNQFPENRMNIEIKLLRKERRVDLWLNGQLETRVADPVATPPNGNRITIQCNNPTGTWQTISNLQVAEYQNTHARQLAEERGDLKSDIIITRDEDRWGGNLLAITPSADSNILLFKSDFLNEPMEVPQSEVSTLRFARKPEAHPTVAGTYTLKLHGLATLQCTDCTINNGSLTITHPLLGQLHLPTASISKITRIPAPDPTGTAPEQ